MACGILSPICDPIGTVVGGAANDAAKTFAKTLAHGFGDMVTTITTFWTRLDVPSLAGGPIATLQGDLYWLQGFIVVSTLLFAAAKMALTRSGKPAGQATGAMMLTVVATSIGLTAIDLASASGDQFCAWIINQSSGGQLSSRLSAIADMGSLAGTSPGLVIVLAILGIIASLAQLALLLARIGVLGILAGTLPVTSAATNTKTGRAWFERVMCWIIAFVLYKPVAAIVYATAFYMIGSGHDITSVLSGLVLLIMSVLALPALLRLVTPVVSGAMHGGSGGMALAAGGALATGAKMLADRAGSRGPSGSAAATGKAGLSSGPPATGGPGAAGSPGRGASSGPAGSAAAFGAASAGFKAAKAGYGAAKGATEHAAGQGA